MITTTNIPALFLQTLSSNLLSAPSPKFHDDSEVFERIYFYIKKRLIKKSCHNPKWQRKCEQLEKDYLELYERVKKKEKDCEGTKKNKTQEPFYRIECIDKRNRNIFEGLRYASYKTVHEFKKIIRFQRFEAKD